MSLLFEILCVGPRRDRLAKAALALTLPVLALLIAWVWLEPAGTPDGPALLQGGPPAEAAREAPQKASMQVMVERDLFSPLRAAPRPVQRVRAAPPPLPSPPVKPPMPRLVLVGTVLLADREAAILEHLSTGQRSTYRVGDSIEGFVVREIGREAVLLYRDEEPMRVTMSEPAPGPSQERRAGSRQGPARDIPRGLVPEPR